MTPAKKPSAARSGTKVAKPAPARANGRSATTAKAAANAKGAVRTKAAPGGATSTRAVKTTSAGKAAASKAPAATKSSNSKAAAPAKRAATKVGTAKATAVKAAAKSAPKPGPAAKAAGKATAAAKPASRSKAAPAAPGTKARTARAATAPAKGPYAGDTKFLTEIRESLLAERGVYLEQANDLKAEAESLAQEREPGDVQFDEESGEGGTVTVDRERDLALSAQALAAVEEIDAALERVEATTYGACERCHQPIPKPRLKALPYARLCVACKSGGLSRR